MNSVARRSERTVRADTSAQVAACVLILGLVFALGCGTSLSEGTRRMPSEGFGDDFTAAALSTTTGKSLLVGEEEKIRASWEARWPGDFSGIALCVDMQTDGLTKTRRFVEAHDIQSGHTTPEAQILDSCSRNRRSLDGRSDWSGIGLCVEVQADGLRKVQRFVGDHGIQPGDTTPEAQILETCSRKWRNADGRPDWSGIALCVEMQWDGYGRLHPSG